MVKKLLTIILMIVAFAAKSQTPVSMGAQTNFTYTETFADISNWTFQTNPDDGTFIAGNGAAAWQGLAVNTVGTIPSATRITTGSTFFQIPPSGNGGYSGGIYKGNQKIEMLSTGTTNNTSSVAIDFFMDFTGVNAGTLSFDWASINNSTGNRSSSLKVYATIDGVAYIEISAAEVLNFTNNNPTAGSVTNIQLPTLFNNASTARLRFYYYNGTGGSSGSRPRLSIDNVKVTAVPTAPCTMPTAQPTNFTLGTVIHNAISFSFDAATPAPHDYMIVMSNNNTVTSLPVNGITYDVGDALGDATVMGITNNTNFTATGLDLSTTYYFFIFSVNNSCTGGPLYLTTNPLTGNATTTAGALPCVAPAIQPTNLTFNNITTSSISGSFTPAANTDEYLIIRSLSPTFSGTLNNGTTYSGGMAIGNGSVITRTAGTTFTANSLVSGTTYYFYVFGLNRLNCTAGPAYNTTNPLTGNISTVALPVCVAPATQPTQLNLVASNNYITGYFTPSSTVDGYLIIRTTTPTLSATPQNNTTYTVGNNFGNGIVIQNNTATAIIDVNLTASTTYYYHIFAKNDICTGGVAYLTINPLIGNATTTALAVSNWYYGNLHAHSSYSDGNQDNTSLTPANDYAYAKNSLCMNFLGISEHNHAGAGMNISNWQPGLSQAAAATTPDFLALYGMEWGVISNGGHVLIYGTDQLIGWETNNYNVYVPKSNYTGTPETNGTTGLFRTINNLGGNAFATLAHPSFSDYNGLANISYNATADSAIMGSAVASGLAFSTNTTYSNPPSAYGYLDYYTRMLSKGYHIGPTMDHDNHYTNYGRSNNNRLVVIAPSLTQSNFYTAMRNRNFYATEDCDTKVIFTLNNASMGSIITGTTAPSISVYAYDPTNPSFTPTIRLMYGIAGSGVLPVQITSANSNILSFTDFPLTEDVNAYYYADISIAGNRTITAPIWHTKTIAVPVKLISFNATLNNERNWVNIAWTTANEINNNYFVVEKSEDGIHFITVDSVKAKNMQNINSYTALDKMPYAKITYYRLKQVDVDGKYTYSTIVAVRMSNNHYTFNIYPNPVHDVAMAEITSATATNSNIIITDIAGRIIKQQPVKLQRGTQKVILNLSNVQQGNYQATIYLNGEFISRKIMKL
ncbi:MAG: T9SS type A sorting domain-containing protein [Chitinophagaceae bacterium]|nr:T9SS type A sorting domain-containing protein [Chitinophagaceae bacterium]MCW5904975.1 T9SS type A sorting domain-containing protein [Chitinophagaceae bacterium]